MSYVIIIWNVEIRFHQQKGKYDQNTYKFDSVKRHQNKCINFYKWPVYT